MVGETSSQANMPQSITKMVIKKIAVGIVQYIQSKLMGKPLLYAAQGESLGKVVAYKPDDQRTRDNGENAVGG